MPKSLIRIIALLLVPCLLSDSILASGLIRHQPTLGFPTTAQNSSKISQFSVQAIPTALVNFSGDLPKEAKIIEYQAGAERSRSISGSSEAMPATLPRSTLEWEREIESKIKWDTFPFKGRSPRNRKIIGQGLGYMASLIGVRETLKPWSHVNGGNTRMDYLGRMSDLLSNSEVQNRLNSLVDSRPDGRELLRLKWREIDKHDFAIGVHSLHFMIQEWRDGTFTWQDKRPFGFFDALGRTIGFSEMMRRIPEKDGLWTGQVARRLEADRDHFETTYTALIQQNKLDKRILDDILFEHTKAFGPIGHFLLAAEPPPTMRALGIGDRNSPRVKEFLARRPQHFVDALTALQDHRELLEKLSKPEWFGSHIMASILEFDMGILPGRVDFRFFESMKPLLPPSILRLVEIPADGAVSVEHYIDEKTFDDAHWLLHKAMEPRYLATQNRGWLRQRYTLMAVASLFDLYETAGGRISGSALRYMLLKTLLLAKVEEGGLLTDEGYRKYADSSMMVNRAMLEGPAESIIATLWHEYSHTVANLKGLYDLTVHEWLSDAAARAALEKHGIDRHAELWKESAYFDESQENFEDENSNEVHDVARAQENIFDDIFDQVDSHTGHRLLMNRGSFYRLAMDNWVNHPNLALWQIAKGSYYDYFRRTGFKLDMETEAKETVHRGLISNLDHLEEALIEQHPLSPAEPEGNQEISLRSWREGMGLVALWVSAWWAVAWSLWMPGVLVKTDTDAFGLFYAPLVGVGLMLLLGVTVLGMQGLQRWWTPEFSRISPDTLFGLPLVSDPSVQFLQVKTIDSHSTLAASPIVVHLLGVPVIGMALKGLLFLLGAPGHELDHTAGDRFEGRVYLKNQFLPAAAGFLLGYLFIGLSGGVVTAAAFVALRSWVKFRRAQGNRRVTRLVDVLLGGITVEYFNNGMLNLLISPFLPHERLHDYFNSLKGYKVLAWLISEQHYGIIAHLFAWHSSFYKVNELPTSMGVDRDMADPVKVLWSPLFNNVLSLLNYGLPNILDIAFGTVLLRLGLLRHKIWMAVWGASILFWKANLAFRELTGHWTPENIGDWPDFGKAGNAFLNVLNNLISGHPFLSVTPGMQPAQMLSPMALHVLRFSSVIAITVAGVFLGLALAKAVNWIWSKVFPRAVENLDPVTISLVPTADYLKVAEALEILSQEEESNLRRLKYKSPQWDQNTLTRVQLEAALKSLRGEKSTKTRAVFTATNSKGRIIGVRVLDWPVYITDLKSVEVRGNDVVRTEDQNRKVGRQLRFAAYQWMKDHGYSRYVASIQDSNILSIESLKKSAAEFGATVYVRPETGEKDRRWYIVDFNLPDANRQPPIAPLAAEPDKPLSSMSLAGRHGKGRIRYDAEEARRDAMTTPFDIRFYRVLRGPMRVAPVLVQQMQFEAKRQGLRIWVAHDRDGAFIQRDEDLLVINADAGEVSLKNQVTALVHEIRGHDWAFVSKELNALPAWNKYSRRLQAAIQESYALAMGEFRNVLDRKEQINQAINALRAVQLLEPSAPEAGSTASSKFKSCLQLSQVLGKSVFDVSERQMIAEALQTLLEKTLPLPEAPFSSRPPQFGRKTGPIVSEMRDWIVAILPQLWRAGLHAEQANDVAEGLVRLEPDSVERLVADGWLTRSAADHLHSLHPLSDFEVQILVKNILADQELYKRIGLSTQRRKSILQQFIPRKLFDFILNFAGEKWRVNQLLNQGSKIHGLDSTPGESVAATLLMADIPTIEIPPEIGSPKDHGRIAEYASARFTKYTSGLTEMTDFLKAFEAAVQRALTIYPNPVYAAQKIHAMMEAALSKSRKDILEFLNQQFTEHANGNTLEGKPPDENGARAELINAPLSWPSDHGLSLREREVANLIAKGWVMREIADKLKIAPKTSDNHRDNIRRKLLLIGLPQSDLLLGTLIHQYGLMDPLPRAKLLSALHRRVEQLSPKPRLAADWKVVFLLGSRGLSRAEIAAALATHSSSIDDIVHKIEWALQNDNDISRLAEEWDCKITFPVMTALYAHYRVTPALAVPAAVPSDQKLSLAERSS